MNTRIYLVVTDTKGEDDYAILGVFDTKFLAENYAKKLVAKMDYDREPVIEVYTLNKEYFG